MSQKIHITCPHCLAVNRVEQAKLQSSIVNCGKCHQPLFTGQPWDVNQAAFEKHIKHTEVPVLVDFWAPWCEPCKMMAPAYAQAAQMLEPEVRLLKINTEHEQVLGATYHIRSIPTLALFKQGQEVARQPGAMGANDIVNWARSVMA